jgi:hypothetical protein
VVGRACALATKEPGPKFGLRPFHDVVLKDGAVPLDVREENVRAWIAANQKSQAVFFTTDFTDGHRCVAAMERSDSVAGCEDAGRYSASEVGACLQAIFRRQSV